MREQIVQVQVPSRLYEKFKQEYLSDISTEEKRELYREADWQNTPVDQHIMEEALIPYFLEELGYSEDAQIGHRGNIVEPDDD